MIAAPDMRRPEILRLGTTVGRYVILDVLGQGGMGVVYNAYDEKLGRKLAIKLLRPDQLQSAPQFATRLLREAQAMARLRHPNVVSIFDVGTYEDRVFLVMEFVEGCTLTKWLETKPPWRERLEALLAAGEGLSAAHEAGIIHRDFKPDNILIGATGRVLVTDFGLARDSEPETADMLAVPENAVKESLPPPSIPPPSVVPSAGPNVPAAPVGPSGDAFSGTPFSAPLTIAGHVLGTVGFMAPEQAHGQPTSVATDQFSYCATLYFALYGKLPFAGDSVGAYLRAIHKRALQEPARSNVPAWIRAVLVKGMSRKPEQRYGSMQELLHALRDDPRKRWQTTAVFAAAAASAIGLGAFSLRANDSRESRCAPSRAEWASEWDGPARAEAKRAFESVDPVHGRDAFERAAAGLDTYVAKWVEMSVDSCRATKVERMQSEEVFTLRTECLGRRKGEIASVSRMLRHADPDVVKQGVSIAYSLESLSWCNDVDALRASAGLPDDPEKRAKVQEVRAKLADVKALDAAGKPREAAALAAEAVVLARPIGHGPTLAEALFAAGDMRQAQGGYAESVAPLREAFLVAFGASADALVVEVASTLSFVTGPKLQHADEARGWLDTARAALKRSGGGEALEVHVLETDAVLANEVDWRPDLAVSSDERLVNTMRRLYGRHPQTELALYNAGVTFSYLGDAARALPYFEEALGISESLGGPLSAGSATDKYMLGKCSTQVGDFSRGETLLKRAVASFDDNDMPYWSALALESLTWSAVARGALPEAAADAEKSLAYLAKANSPSVLVPIVNTQAAVALTRVGRASEAIPLCERALAEQEKAKAIYAEKAYGWDALRCKGEALVALGRSAEAIPYLERSLTIRQRMAPGDYARAEFALARALANSHRDLLYAEQLARAAQEEFARSPFLTFETKEVEAWLRAPRK